MPKIVSFSGIDGAGKSTQIEAFVSWLAAAGLRSSTLTFWDDVVVGSRAREFMSHKVFKGDQGIGSPSKPVSRRDKNVTSGFVTAARLYFYLADAISLSLMVRKVRRSGADVVIFDRYIYDELANLPLNRQWARAFVWMILRLAPKPDVAYVIDADPDDAFARKPEYPLDFLRRNRYAFLALSGLTRDITIIEPLPVEKVAARVRKKFLPVLSSREERLSTLPALD